MATSPVDYNALAAQSGAISSTPAPQQPSAPPATPQGQPVNYAALAAQNGAISSSPSAPTPAPAGMVRGSDGQLYPQPNDYLSKAEDAISSGATGLGQAAGDVWSVVKYAVQHPVATGVSMLTNGGLVGPGEDIYGNIKESIPVIQAYENARSQGKSITDALSAANDQAAKQNQARQVLKQRIDDFKKNPTQATTRAIGDAAAVAGAIWAGNEVMGAIMPEAEAGAADAVAGEAESTTAPSAAPETQEQPGLVQQIVKGEDVAQPQAQQALRAGTQTATEDAGIADESTANNIQNGSLRTIVEEPADNLESSAKAAYRQIDEAAGTDFKALNEKLDNTEYQIRQLTDTEADQATEAKLEASRTGLMEKIEAAKQQALDNGVDPKLLDQADSQFTQARALKDLDAKVFKNPSVIKGNAAMGTEESVNVSSAVKALQKLQDNNKFGTSRLEQALGKDGANKLLQNMYAAQRAGQTALTRQAFAKMIGKFVGLPLAGGALGALGYEAIK